MSETVEDIVREMRETARCYLAGCNTCNNTYEMLSVFSDRIEASYKNMAGMWILPTENAKLREENERLKAALEPVLEVEWVKKHYNYCSGFVPTKDTCQAIMEAQRIYKGGAK